MKKFKKFVGDENIVQFEKAYAKSQACAKKLAESSDRAMQALEDDIYYSLQNKERVIRTLSNAQAKYLKNLGYSVKSNGNHYVITY
jgi:hypothetical protein